MLKIFDVLLVIGILMNLVKGADLILRPHQQIYMNEKFSSLTLWLDYKRPLDWYKQLSSSTGRTVLIIFCLLVVIVERAYYIQYKAPVISSHFPVVHWFLTGVGLTLTIVFVIRYSRAVTNFLLDGEGYKSLIAKYCLVNILIFIYTTIVIFVLLLPILLPIEDAYLFLLILMTVVVVAMPVGILLGYLFILGTILLISAAFLLLLEVLLKISRAVAWRIVEYNRGVFAAIILILTLVLGIVELFVKSR